MLINVNLLGEHSNSMIEIFQMLADRFTSMNTLMRKYEELIMKLLLGKYTYFWSEDREEDEHLMTYLHFIRNGHSPE